MPSMPSAFDSLGQAKSDFLYIPDKGGKAQDDASQFLSDSRQSSHLGVAQENQTIISQPIPVAPSSKELVAERAQQHQRTLRTYLTGRQDSTKVREPGNRMSRLQSQIGPEC